MRQAYDYWQDQPGISRTPLSSNRDPSRSHGPSKGPSQPEFQCPNQRAAPLFHCTQWGARHPTNFPSVAEHFSNKRDFGARRPKPVMKQKFSRVRFNVPAANRFRGQNCGCAVRNFCCFCEGQIEKNFSPESAPLTAQTVFRFIERRLHLLVRTSTQIFHFFPPSHIPKQLLVAGYKLFHSHLLHWCKWKFFILYLPVVHPHASGGQIHYISPWKLFKNF